MAKTSIVWSGDKSSIVFDANEPYTIKITYNGNQAIKNRIVIRENESNEVVYDQTIEAMRLEHSVPPETLINGAIYNVVAQVFYYTSSNELVSDVFSDPVLIHCSSTPVIRFSNILDGAIVRNSSFDLQVEYIQDQRVLPSRYIVRLYDNGRNEIWSSGSRYSTASTVPTLIDAELTDLFDKQQYYISCEVESILGLTGSTDMVSFSVLYERPRSYSTMYLENIPELCAIRITSNLKIIDAIINGEPPEYIDGELIDLSSGNTTISWQDMGVLDMDFQIMLLISYGEEAGKRVMRLSNPERTVEVRIMRGLLYGETDEKLYVELYVLYGDLRYFTTSNLLDLPDPQDKYCVSVSKRGAFYTPAIWREA